MKPYKDILAKIFFYGNLPTEKALELIKHLIEDINKKVENLEKLETKVKYEVEHFEISTLYFGIDHLKFMLNWYEKFLIDLNKS
jgi:hypothetical protein